MANQTETHYPPYGGQEPYIHLCFSERDGRRVRPLLRRLLLRGCRVWYDTGHAYDRNAQTVRNSRMLGAGLTVLYLTEAARRDTDLKNRLLLCQKSGQPILVLDTDGGDRNLSVGLTRAGFVTVLGGAAPDALDAILHGPGFSQLFLGDPLPIDDRLWLRRLNIALLLLSFFVAGSIGVYRYLHPPVPPAAAEPAPELQDAVTFADEALKEAVRAAIGGGPITEEAVAGLESLRLVRLPESEEDLAKLPHLTTLILSQAAAQRAPDLPGLYDRYTLIVAGGEAE